MGYGSPTVSVTTSTTATTSASVSRTKSPKWKCRASIEHTLASPSGIQRLDIEIQSITTAAPDWLIPSAAEAQSVYYVDPTAVPLWNVSTRFGVWDVKISNHQTLDFFNQLLQTSDYDSMLQRNAVMANLGLVIELSGTGPQHQIMIYFRVSNQQNRPALSAIPLVKSSEYETILLNTKVEPGCPAKFLTTNNYLKKQKETKFEQLVQKRGRSTTPLLPDASSSSTPDNNIYKKPVVTTATTTESPQSKRNKNTISQVIMSAFRLRGIKRSDNEDEYKQMYHHALKCTTFALRREIDNNQLSVEQIEEKVEQILNVLE